MTFQQKISMRDVEKLNNINKLLKCDYVAVNQYSTSVFPIVGIGGKSAYLQVLYDYPMEIGNDYCNYAFDCLDIKALMKDHKKDMDSIVNIPCDNFIYNTMMDCLNNVYKDLTRYKLIHHIERFDTTGGFDEFFNLKASDGASKIHIIDNIDIFLPRSALPVNKSDNVDVFVYSFDGSMYYVKFIIHKRHARIEQIMKVLPLY